MAYPKQVLETVSYLEQVQDPRFKTMQALVTPRETKEELDNDRDYPAKDDYERMWKAIKRHEEKIRGELSTNEWVLDFLDDVIEAQKLPEYMYIKNERRLELIQKIDLLVRELNSILLKNKSFGGIRLKQALRRNDLKDREKGYPLEDMGLDPISETDITQILDSYCKSLITDIASAESLTKDGKGIEERMFAIALVKRNNFLYGTPLNEVVATAIWAIYERNNSPTTILNLVKRSQEF